MPRPVDVLIGFGANFFDTWGISSFATTTAAFKLTGRVSDEQIPGTLNAGHALPTILQAVIFIVAVSVDRVTLVTLIAAAVAGAWFGSGIVSRLAKQQVRVGMVVAMLVAAAMLTATNLHLMPGGGNAVGLSAGPLVFAAGVNCGLGALMTLGVGLYAPCLILVSLLGMSPMAAFPIMMGSCAFLMPVGAVRFIQQGRYDVRAALGLTLGGIPAVLVAAFMVKSLPVVWMRWLVVGVVLYTATMMLLAAWRGRAESL